MFELILVRHGQTDWNVERRVMGAKPIPLNVVGIKVVTSEHRFVDKNVTFGLFIRSASGAPSL